MANSSLELLKVALKSRGAPAISPQAEEICKLLDHFREQHCFDRNRYAEMAKAQADEISLLRARIAELEQASRRK